jgi:hypothetical protein
LGFERSEHVIGVILHHETLYRAALRAAFGPCLDIHIRHFVSSVSVH